MARSAHGGLPCRSCRAAGTNAASWHQHGLVAASAMPQKANLDVFLG